MSLFEYNRGRTSVKCYPTAGLDPASGLSIGVLSLVSVEPKEKDERKIKFYRPTSITNSLSYSTKKWLNFSSDMMIYASHGIVVSTLLQYQISPDKFYGIGNDTLNTDPVKFDMNDLRLSGNVSKEISSTCYLGFMFDFSHRDCSSHGSNENGLDLPEIKNNWLVGFGPHFIFDRRDHVNYPAHGEYITFGAKYFPRIDKNAYTFYCIELDIRKYLTLYKDWILACQLFNGFSDGDSPFYCLYQLGVDTSVILTSAGVLSLIIGYGSQSMVSDLVNGIFLITEDQIRIGDTIWIDNFRGEVQRIGLRTTTLKHYASVKVINNSKMAGFFNFSRDTNAARWEISFPIEQDIEQAKSLIMNNGERFQKACKGNILAGPIFIGVKEGFLDHTGHAHYTMQFLFVCDIEEWNSVRKRSFTEAYKILLENGIKPTGGEMKKLVK